MSKPQLQKATITVLDGADKNKIITVLFNPTEYSFDRTNSYKATAVPGLGSPILQFVNGECDQLSMELFLDDYTDPQGPTSLAQKEDDPDEWVRIAEANDLDDPRAIAPGDWLVLPPIENPNGPRNTL